VSSDGLNKKRDKVLSFPSRLHSPDDYSKLNLQAYVVRFLRTLATWDKHDLEIHYSEEGTNHLSFRISQGLTFPGSSTGELEV